MFHKNVQEPLVSIVIPTLNSEKTIRSTLESLSLLYYKNFEVIVVDGKSTDNTLGIVKEYQSKYNIRIVIEEKRGRGIAYNRGIIEGKGKYIAFLDSDAKLGSKGWIRNAVEIMEENEKIGVVFTKVFAPPDSKYIQKSIDTFLCKGYTTANGAIYRKEAVAKVKGFNENMNYMQEDELLYKLTNAGYEFRVNYNDKIYHYHRQSIKSYIKQNSEAAIGAKLYYSFTKQSWIVKDSLIRIFIFVFSIIIIVLFAINFPLLLIPLAVLFYIGLFIKVNMQTCPQYRWSKYTLFAPILIYLSMLGYSIGFLTNLIKQK
jgi:glycosyltransferase involved in cell wall biosynthesis